MKIQEWLNTTKAKDIMIAEVETLKTSDLIQSAAEKLSHKQISGAPVVDDNGACVGVLSTSDFLSAEEKADRVRREVADSSFFKSSLALPSRIYEEEMAAVRDKIAPVAEQPVKNFMTTDVVSVEAESPVSKIIQFMVDAHVHRVLVMSADKRLLGIVSTTDVLAALLRIGGMD